MEHLIGAKIEKELCCTENRFYFLIKNGSSMGTKECTDREAMQHLIDNKLTGLIPHWLAHMVKRTYKEDTMEFTYKLI